MGRLCTDFQARVGLAMVSQRHFSRFYFVKCSIENEASGWPTRSRSCIQVLTPQNVSLSYRDVVQDSAVDYLTARIEHDLKWYHFTGRMVGKAIYEGHFVGVSFAGFFVNKVFPNLPQSAEQGRSDSFFAVVRQAGEFPG
jgi:hypothetical protein